MGANAKRTQHRTLIARCRIERDLDQWEAAYLAGLSHTMYRRLETGRHPNPPIRYLVNIALAFNLEDPLALVEGQWREWLPTEHNADLNHAELERARWPRVPPGNDPVAPAG